MLNKCIRCLCWRFYNIGKVEAGKKRIAEFRKGRRIHPTVTFFQPEETSVHGNVKIGEHTYLNRSMLSSGMTSKIVIGKWCAIGFNTYIFALTHDTERSTGPAGQRPAKEGDIIIGDYVWIGANCYIREGVTIGSNAVIGANSVVTRDIPENAIAAGVPAKVIRFKQSYFPQRSGPGSVTSTGHPADLNRPDREKTDGN